MKTFQNEIFIDQVLQLDSCQFIACTFTRCFLQYSGGPFGFMDCLFQDNRIEFQGAALQTIWFLKQMGWTLPAGLDVIEKPPA